MFEGIIQSKQDVLDLVSIILNDAMVRHLLNNNNDTIHSKRPLNERERDVHVHNNRQMKVGQHRMLIQLHESEKEHGLFLVEGGGEKRERGGAHERAKPPYKGGDTFKRGLQRGDLLHEAYNDPLRGCPSESTISDRIMNCKYCLCL